MDLADALASGEGVERPFRCHMHDDNSASASVNVLKGVWYCFACHAKGTTDGKNKPPSLLLLQSMLEPEANIREYPAAWLELFRNDLGDWPKRFEQWSRSLYEMGCDPLSGEATFPVWTPQGSLAGVGRRNPDPEAKPRYRYPSDWSASRVLGTAGHSGGPRISVLVEGRADAVAVAETGLTGCAVFGSGLHLPQLEQLYRQKPHLILLGFDADEAGQRGADHAAVMLADKEPVRVHWDRFNAKDPAELELGARVQALRQAVVGAGYPDPLAEMLAARDEAVKRWEQGDE